MSLYAPKRDHLIYFISFLYLRLNILLQNNYIKMFVSMCLQALIPSFALVVYSMNGETFALITKSDNLFFTNLLFKMSDNPATFTQYEVFSRKIYQNNHSKLKSPC